MTRRLVLLLPILAALLLANVAEAQWQEVSLQMFRPNYRFSGGAMTYRDGVVWAGANDLWKSTNTGRSWFKTTMPASRVYDIAAFDDSVVAVATLDRGTLLTTDQGTTWRDIHGRAATKVSFGDDASTIISQSSSEFVRTTDRGTTWTTIAPLFTGASFRTRGTTIYHIGDKQLRYSSDNGATWTATPGLFDRDSWDLALDSCQPSTMYVVNEELYLFDDSQPAIYITTNIGTSWTVATPPGAYCGNAATSVSQLFVQTADRGTLASGDHGVTWRNIGGPVGPPDQTLIAVIEDSVLLVADTAGAIWRTRIVSNRQPAVVPGFLFATDSLSMCADPLLAALAVRTGCATIDSIRIDDPTGSYRIDRQANRSDNTLDSVIIGFQPKDPTNLPATGRVYLSTGETLTFSLLGTGLPAELARLGQTSILATAIGQDIRIPIAITSAASTARLHVAADYDTTILRYESTVRTDGSRVNSVTEAPAGHLSIDLDVVSPIDDTVGYITFRWFPQSYAKTTVTLDSLSVAAAAGHCVFSVNGGVVVPIEGSEDCANGYLSRFLRYGAHAITLVPNPAQAGSVGVTGLRANTLTTVTVADALGRSVARVTHTSDALGTIELSIGNLAQGVYEVTCVSDDPAGRPVMSRASLVVRR